MRMSSRIDVAILYRTGEMFDALTSELDYGVSVDSGAVRFERCFLNSSSAYGHICWTGRIAECGWLPARCRLANRVGMVNVSGGWHTHLAVLVERLNGRKPFAFWTL